MVSLSLSLPLLPVCTGHYGAHTPPTIALTWSIDLEYKNPILQPRILSGRVMLCGPCRSKFSYTGTTKQFMIHLCPQLASTNGPGWLRKDRSSQLWALWWPV
jgi:hypothetical protein